MTHDTWCAPGTDRLHERQPADDELVMLIEQEEIALGKEHPVPRRELSRRVSVALWALRIFVIDGHVAGTRAGIAGFRNQQQGAGQWP